jgi:transcriptional regulator with PAS, ATPase and Fis domain
LASQAALMLASHSELSSAKRQNAKYREMLGDGGLIFDRERSPMISLIAKLQKIAPTPLSTLILGETGTGKEVIAREIHRVWSLENGKKSKAPFIAVNCAAIPATLLESTLFGFEKGAFTGATRSQPGKFAQADGGTLFLDEIGDLPLDLQAKLLRALQEKRIDPIGALESVKVDVRIVAATHQNIEQQIKQGKFRQDLYYRLSGAILELPPLKARVVDIEPLAEFFLSQAGVGKSVSEAALNKMRRHNWPGNVRELEQAITRAAFLAEGNQIEENDLEIAESTSPEAGASDRGELDLSFSSLDEAQGAFTREYVLRTLEKSAGNRLAAANRLGISERTLYRILSAGSANPGRLS